MFMRTSIQWVVFFIPLFYTIFEIFLAYAFTKASVDPDDEDPEDPGQQT
jgi:hypothetical protein